MPAFTSLLPIKGDSFSAALAMIASLPLSDAEKTDAVRRLMAEQFPKRGRVGSLAGITLRAIEAGDTVARLEALESILKSRPKERDAA